MGLLIDGQVNSTQELRNYENSILDLASSENIDLTGKMALAQDEVGIEILHFLLKQESRDPNTSPDVLSGQNHRRRLGVADIVATPELKRWMAVKTLQLAYADAYSNQLNDRYASKLKQYEALVENAAESYFESGVGVTTDPVGRASAPELNAIAGVGQAATFYVEASWTNLAGQEGLASQLTSFSTTNGMQLIATPGATASAAPGNVTGWNIYAGYTPDQLTLQNDTPIPIGTSWTAPPTGLRTGRRPGDGQTADRYIVNNRVWSRG